MRRAEIDELTAIPGGPIGPISPRSPCQINAVVDYIEGINICSLCSWKQMSGVKKKIRWLLQNTHERVVRFYDQLTTHYATYK